MKRVFFYITIVFFLLDSKARAQNLVLNPSFENLTIDCCDYPLGTNPYLMLQYWTNANSPTGYSMADLSHRCLSCVIPSYSLPEYAPLGQQNPRTGNGFAGQYTIDYENFPPMFSEYIQGKLSSPLSSNRTYIVSIWISLADMVNYTYADYGIYFSNSQLNENSLFLDYLSPQITLDSYISKRDGWQNFKYYFNAMGGESFFSFGTFIPYDQLDTLMMICDSI